MSQTYSDKQGLPAWFPVSVAARYSGLSRALIYKHIQDGSLTSSTVKRPDRSRGRRLVHRESLDRLIEAGIGAISADNTKTNAAKKAGRRD